MNRLLRVREFLLGHFHRQKRRQNGTADGGSDAEYDDRQSIPPFVQEEQRLETLAHQAKTNKEENGEAPHQYELVKWTKILAIVTGGLAFATFLVAGFAGWQAWETRSAGVETKNAVEATNRLANAAESGQRAFVLFQGLDAFAFRVPEDSNLRWYVAPVVENSGNTPTRDMRVEAITCPRQSDLPRDFSFPHHLGESVPIDLGPKQRTDITGSVILGALLPQIEAGTMKFYIFGRATYTDIIRGQNDPHITKFCYVLNRFIGTPSDPNAKIGHSLCWTHADGECDHQEKERPPANDGARAIKDCELNVVLEKK